ncbi:MAG: chloride channel protein [Acidobacteriota bacterium]
MRTRFQARSRLAGARLRAGWRRVEFALARRFALATQEDRVFFLLIPFIGLAAGIIGILVARLSWVVQALLWGEPEGMLDAAIHAPMYVRFLAPVAGGLFLAWIILRAGRPVAGHGVSRLLEAVTLKGGKVDAEPVLWSAGAAIVTVGSGGSLGREGPAVGLGAMVASWLGIRLGLPPHRVKILIGCGAAAGMAAIYNTPIGGALFAMEVILGNFALEIFGPIVVASVISTVVGRWALGSSPIYAAPGYKLVSSWELLAYAGLGILGAVISVAFVLGIKGVGALFDRLNLHRALRPVFGMALVGAIGMYVPYVYGNGFDTITQALHENLPLTLLLILPLAKLLATAFTAGGGGSGGMFTPSMCVGALVGGAYGFAIHELFPHSTGPYGAYAAVGMAAIAAGTSHAPISSILILFEFTGNYDLILPLMIAAISSSVLSRWLYPASIYTGSLLARGIDINQRREETVLASLLVRDLVRPDFETLKPTDTYKQLVERFLGTRRQRLFVVNDAGELLGGVSLHDIKHALEEPGVLLAVLAHDLMLPVGVTLTDGDRIPGAIEAFARSDSERLPVLGADGKYRGVLAKRDVMAVYTQEVLGRPALLATFVSAEGESAGRNYVELPPDFAVRSVSVPARLVGRTLAETRLAQSSGVRVLEIKRRRGEVEERVIPDGAAILGAADILVVLGPSAAVEALERGEPTPAGSPVTIVLDS